MHWKTWETFPELMLIACLALVAFDITLLVLYAIMICGMFCYLNEITSTLSLM